MKDQTKPFTKRNIRFFQTRSRTRNLTLKFKQLRAATMKYFCKTETLVICFGCIIESIQGTQKDIDKEKIQDSHLVKDKPQSSQDDNHQASNG